MVGGRQLQVLPNWPHTRSQPTSPVAGARSPGSGRDNPLFEEHLGRTGPALPDPAVEAVAQQLEQHREAQQRLSQEQAAQVRDLERQALATCNRIDGQARTIQSLSDKVAARVPGHQHDRAPGPDPEYVHAVR